MKERAVLVVAGSVLVAIVLAVAATTTTPQIVGGPPEIGGFDTSDRVVEQPTVPTLVRDRPRHAPDRRAPVALSVTFGILVLASVAAFVGFAIARAIQAWRNRPRVVWRRERAEWDDVDTHDAAIDPVATAMAADADAQRAALQRGTARNGIVECWLRFETVVADAGIPPRSSDTSSELTERVLADSAVDPLAIERLSSLYREARFSTHPMGEDERVAAVSALDAVHAALRARAANRDRVTEPARSA